MRPRLEFVSATDGDDVDERTLVGAATWRQAQGFLTTLSGVAAVPRRYGLRLIRSGGAADVKPIGDGRAATSGATEPLPIRFTPEEPRSARFSYGWVALIVLCSAAGLGVLWVADQANRNENTSFPTYVMFWLGVLLIFVPVAMRVLARDVNPLERLTLVVFLGLALYFVKVLGSPYDFTFVDEYVHVRNTHAIISKGHLFTWNPLLDTAAYYPGLAALTAGVVELTGLSMFAAGLLIMGIARVLVCAFFYLIFESVTRSGRGAALASLVYMANPMFLFWCSTFTYGNLAVPLAAFVVWWVGRTRNRGGFAPMVIAVVGIIAVTLTHHVVGFILAGLLVAWWLAERVGCHATKAARRQVGILAMVACGVTFTWFFVVARPAAAYLITGNLLPALQSTVNVIRGTTAPRKLYHIIAMAPPAWEPMAGYAAVLVLLGVLPVALLRARWSCRRAPVAVATMLAIAFPLSLVPRFAPNGVAVSGRSSEYVYTGLGCVFGLLFAAAATRWYEWRLSGRGGRAGRGSKIRTGRLANAIGNAWRDSLVPTAIAAALVTVVFVGNVTVGTRFFERLPEGSNPHGYERSLQPDVIAASIWALQHLGPNNMFGANDMDSWALATYGDQDLADSRLLWPIFFSESINSAIVQNIKELRLRYLLVNWRMTLSIPNLADHYVHTQEPEAGHQSHPFPPAALEKFSADPCIKLIYDAGPIQIYDASQIESGACS
ncbi:hypothetical protein [Mycobacterium sp. E2327]|uniref:hypothetical protein n=1 Tax=Mycobacterium sp. E2327 TaxID=1834132 RepID=UPI000A4EB529|nr:hypothetical protein [Mycobacterium sp. E2327]